MREIAFHLEGTTPLLMHNPQLVDPFNEYVRELKSVTSKARKTDEDHERIAALEWLGGLYVDSEGRVVQPTSHLRKALIQTAALSRLGKSVERALSMTRAEVPVEHDGPGDLGELYAGKYVSRLSVGSGATGKKRVMRTRPSFMPWRVTVPAVLIEDAGLDYEALERIVELAGRITGIGDGRAIGFGRFVGTIEVTA